MDHFQGLVYFSVVTIYMFTKFRENSDVIL